MKLKMDKYVVPIYNENIIGKNKSSIFLSDSSVDFFDNMEDILIDEKFKLFLKYIGPGSKNKIKDFICNKLDDIDICSKTDLEKISLTLWVFYFECADDTCDKIIKRINYFLLASRIFANADFGVEYYICLSNKSNSIKISDSWGYSVASFKEIKTEDFVEISEQNLRNIIDGYKKLLEFNSINPLTQHAIQFLFLSYTAYYSLESFILLMTSIETLVTPSKLSNTLTNDIISRVVRFIDNQDICSKTKFDKIYKFRSSIIHGRISVENNLQGNLKNIRSLQTITLFFYRKLLLEIDFNKVYKTGISKDKYFLELLNKKINKWKKYAKINLLSNLRICSKLKV